MAVQPQLQPDWLVHASRLHTCPLCTAVAQFESDYLGALCGRLAEYSSDEVCTTVFRDLCAEHTTAFNRVSLDAGVSSDALLNAHLLRLEELAEQLAELDADGWLSTPPCALCLPLNEHVLLCAHRLLVGMQRDDSPATQQLAQAGGLCTEHFTMCWETNADDESRDALRLIQLAAVRRLADIVRVSPAGDEFDACRTQAVAIRATAITAT